MIREENNRMLTQVENILRISQLDRSIDPLKKTNLDLHVIIEEAIGHIELILANKSGTLSKMYNANNTAVFGNKSHLTNIIVNILDNALKYCESNLKIII